MPSTTYRSLLIYLQTVCLSHRELIGAAKPRAARGKLGLQGVDVKWQRRPPGHMQTHNCACNSVSRDLVITYALSLPTLEILMPCCRREPLFTFSTAAFYCASLSCHLTSSLYYHLLFLLFKCLYLSSHDFLFNEFLLGL